MAKNATIIKSRYDKKHMTQFLLKYHNKNDADIIEKIKSVPSKQDYIRQLIRNDIARTCSVPKTENKSMEDKKMTVRELAQNWIENADVSPVPEIDIEMAKQYIQWMDPHTELPEELTPESFMIAWNDIVRG